MCPALKLLNRPIARVAAQSHALAAAARQLAREVLVKDDATVQLTQAADDRFVYSPWSADITIQELSEFVPDRTSPAHG